MYTVLHTIFTKTHTNKAFYKQEKTYKTFYMFCALNSLPLIIYF